MRNNLLMKLKNYVEKFNSSDEECYKNEISNDDAFEWLARNIPLIECPDPVIEEIYYFRWWTYRKHIKNTPDGYIISEFLPDVPWAGKHNSISAAVGHHLAEGKWLRMGDKYLNDYIMFWLDGKGNNYSYSFWLITAIYDYCSFKGDYTIALENLDKLAKHYEAWEREHLSPCGLLWSVDSWDAMEYSISGTVDSGRMKGFRPTLNSYMAADAYSLSRLFRMAGKEKRAAEYKNKGDTIKKIMTEHLWKGDFFKAVHLADENGEPILGEIPPQQNVRELIGYIPWCFDLAPEGFEKAFSYLLKEDGFYNPFGLTTAEKSHPRYLYEHIHECLWNGYIWPFATSQTLTAVLHLLKNYDQNVIDKNDFYTLLSDYAKSHRIKTDEGYKPWIDEVIDPRDGSWSARRILESWGWKKEVGGYERGKDYNHSTFCDLVLGGLFGISEGDEGISVNPLIPDDWTYFRVNNVCVCGNEYNIIYDKGKLEIQKIN